MPKKTKEQLLEEGADLGLELDADASWADLNDAVNSARDAQDHAQEEETFPVEEHEWDDPLLEDDAPSPAPAYRGEWPFNARGVHTGRAPRR